MIVLPTGKTPQVGTPPPHPATTPETPLSEETERKCFLPQSQALTLQNKLLLKGFHPNNEFKLQCNLENDSRLAYHRLYQSFDLTEQSRVTPFATYSRLLPRLRQKGIHVVRLDCHGSSLPISCETFHQLAQSMTSHQETHELMRDQLKGYRPKIGEGLLDYDDRLILSTKSWQRSLVLKALEETWKELTGKEPPFEPIEKKTSWGNFDTLRIGTPNKNWDLTIYYTPNNIGYIEPAPYIDLTPCFPDDPFEEDDLGKMEYRILGAKSIHGWVYNLATRQFTVEHLQDKNFGWFLRMLCKMTQGFLPSQPGTKNDLIAPFRGVNNPLQKLENSLRKHLPDQEAYRFAYWLNCYQLLPHLNINLYSFKKVDLSQCHPKDVVSTLKVGCLFSENKNVELAREEEQTVITLKLGEENNLSVPTVVMPIPSCEDFSHVIDLLKEHAPLRELFGMFLQKRCQLQMNDVEIRQLCRKLDSPEYPELFLMKILLVEKMEKKETELLQLLKDLPSILTGDRMKLLDHLQALDPNQLSKMCNSVRQLVEKGWDVRFALARAFATSNNRSILESAYETWKGVPSSFKAVDQRSFTLAAILERNPASLALRRYLEAQKDHQLDHKVLGNCLRKHALTVQDLGPYVSPLVDHLDDLCPNQDMPFLAKLFVQSGSHIVLKKMLGQPNVDEWVELFQQNVIPNLDRLSQEEMNQLLPFIRSLGQSSLLERIHNVVTDRLFNQALARKDPSVMEIKDYKGIPLAVSRDNECVDVNVQEINDDIQKRSVKKVITTWNQCRNLFSSKTCERIRQGIKIDMMDDPNTVWKLLSSFHSIAEAHVMALKSPSSKLHEFVCQRLVAENRPFPAGDYSSEAKKTYQKARIRGCIVSNIKKSWKNLFAITEFSPPTKKTEKLAHELLKKSEANPKKKYFRTYLVGKNFKFKAPITPHDGDAFLEEFFFRYRNNGYAMKLSEQQEKFSETLIDGHVLLMKTLLKNSDQESRWLATGLIAILSPFLKPEIKGELFKLFEKKHIDLFFMLNSYREESTKVASSVGFILRRVLLASLLMYCFYLYHKWKKD